SSLWGIYAQSDLDFSAVLRKQNGKSVNTLTSRMEMMTPQWKSGNRGGVEFKGSKSVKGGRRRSKEEPMLALMSFKNYLLLQSLPSNDKGGGGRSKNVMRKTVSILYWSVLEALPNSWGSSQGRFLSKVDFVSHVDFAPHVDFVPHVDSASHADFALHVDSVSHVDFAPHADSALHAKPSLRGGITTCTTLWQGWTITDIPEHWRPPWGLGKPFLDARKIKKP
ncbi:hypothetical protein CR513_00141, partial [Mucuna pruriens]